MAVNWRVPFGWGIRGACAHAVALRLEHQCKIRFRFNDVALCARRSSTTDDLVRLYERRGAHRTPAAKRRRKLERKQEAKFRIVSTRKAKYVCAMLPFALGNIWLVLDWCAALSRYDWRWLQNVLPYDAMANQIEAAGYERNYGVGTVTDESPREERARYVIGQALDCLRRGTVPHPLVQSFREQILGT